VSTRSTVAQLAVLTHWSVRRQGHGPTASTQLAVALRTLDQRTAELPGLDTGGPPGDRD
jgi:hypothetical protein